MARQAALLVASLALCVGLAIVPTVSAQHLTPSFNMGDTLPVSLYIRLHRQTRGFMEGLFGGGAGGTGEMDPGEGMGTAVMDSGAVEREEDAMRMANVMRANGVLSLEREADLIGTKHRNQIPRLIPSQDAPRFGLDRVARLPSDKLVLKAGRELELKPNQEESELALRFSVGRGLNKETTWLPLATRVEQLRSGPLAGMLAPELALELDARMRGENADVAVDPAANTGQPNERSEAPLYYLVQVTMFFGFQKGVLSRVTSLRYEYRYSAKRPTHLELHYVWDEHRPFNPHLAITVCCAVCVAIACSMACAMIGSRSSKASKQFKRRIVVVRRSTD